MDLTLTGPLTEDYKEIKKQELKQEQKKVHNSGCYGIGKEKRKEIIDLYKAGTSKQEIMKKLDISISTVNKTLREERIKNLTDKDYILCLVLSFKIINQEIEEHNTKVPESFQDLIDNYSIDIFVKDFKTIVNIVKTIYKNDFDKFIRENKINIPTNRETAKELLKYHISFLYDD